MGGRIRKSTKAPVEEKKPEKIFTRLNEQGEAKLIILGLDNAGKTAVFNKLKKAETDYKELKPTGGFNT